MTLFLLCVITFAPMVQGMRYRMARSASKDDPLGDKTEPMAWLEAHPLPPDWVDATGKAFVTAVKQVGAGGYGRIFEANVTCSGERFAMKVQEAVELSDHEARVMVHLGERGSRRVVQVLAHGPGFASRPGGSDSADSVDAHFILTELAVSDLESLLYPGGSRNAAFFNRSPVSHGEPKRLPFGQRLQLLAQVLEGLGDMHEELIVHWDIKPGNVLLFEQAGALQAKIADLGLVCSIKKGDREFMACDVQENGANGLYEAPEQMILGRTHTPEPSNDVWATGLIGYELIFGRMPIEIVNHGVKLYDYLTPIAIGFEGAPDVPENLQDDLRRLLAGMLELEPAKRLKAKEALGLAMGVLGQLGQTLPEASVARLPPCWETRKLGPDARLLVALDKGLPVSSELIRETSPWGKGHLLHWAVARGDADLARLVADAVDRGDADSALHNAVSWGCAYGEPRDDLVELLLHGAGQTVVDEVLVSSSQGSTRAHCSAMERAHTFGLLLGDGTRPSQSAQDEALRNAAQFRLADLACVVLERGRPSFQGVWGPLRQTAKMGDGRILTCILSGYARRMEEFGEEGGQAMEIGAKWAEQVDQAALIVAKKAGQGLQGDEIRLYLEAFDVLLKPALGATDEGVNKILQWFAATRKKWDLDFVEKAIGRVKSGLDSVKQGFLDKAFVQASSVGNTPIKDMLESAVSEDAKGLAAKRAAAGRGRGARFGRI